MDYIKKFKKKHSTGDTPVKCTKYKWD
jgi:hypothetical protein